jgi:hypothetical protein
MWAVNLVTHLYLSRGTHFEKHWVTALRPIRVTANRIYHKAYDMGRGEGKGTNSRTLNPYAKTDFISLKRYLVL